MQLTSLMRTVLYRGSYRLLKKNIMTTPRKMQEILDELKGNPYYDKYAQKIAQIQKTAPEEFKSRVEVYETKTNKTEVSKERQYSQLLKPKEKLDAQVQTQDIPLAKLMKVDLIKTKSPDEIKAIWEEYHLQKDCIAATIPSEDFAKLEESSLKYPTFLFPLPRSQGYEFIMCQFESNNIVHFTPLLYFQVHKENAPECLTITHYKEFKDDKGIVLMRGEYDKNIINAKEAQCLANQLQIYYIKHDDEKLRLLESFTSKPESFEHMELVKQISNIPLS